MNKNNSKYIKFCILDEKDLDELVCPTFSPDTASRRNKEEQWLFYFAKHAEAVKEVLSGAEDVLKVSFTWLEDVMPDFAEYMNLSEIASGDYIGVGNKLLKRLVLDKHEPAENAYIGFWDMAKLDEIAKKVRADEIAPKKQEKASKKKKGEKEQELTLGDVLALPDYSIQGEIENIIVLKKSLCGLEQDFFLSAKLVNGELEHELTHYRAIPPQTAPSLDFHTRDYDSLNDIYTELRKEITDFIAFSTDSVAPDLIALGSISSYFREVYFTFPYFDFISSEPEAGKTTAMKVQTFLSFYGTIASSVTEALLFREIDGAHCFYGLDNIERIFSSPKDYIGIIDWLLSSYSRDIPCKRLEKTDEGYEVRYFDGYGIKAFTHIRDFPFALRALRSRCVQIVMQTGKPMKFYPTAEKFTEIRDKLYNARLHEFEEVKKSYESCIKSKVLSGRTGDLYYPLLSIAKLVDKKLYQKVLNYAVTDEVERKELDSWNILLLEVLLEQELFGSRSTNEIRRPYEEALINAGLLKDSNLHTRTVTSRLKKLGFTREDKKTDHKTWYLIDREKLMLKAHDYDIINEDEVQKSVSTHTPPKGTLCTFVTSGEDKDKAQKGSVERGEEDKASTREIDLGSSEEDEEGSKGRKVPKRGVRESKIKCISPAEKAMCEYCGEERFLDHVWEDGEQRHLICAKCTEEIKNGKESKKENEVAGVRSGISKGLGVEYVDLSKCNSTEVEK